MNYEPLNVEELQVLQSEIKEAEIYRKKQLKKQISIFVISTFFAGIILIVTKDFQALPLTLALAAFLLIFLIIVSFAWFVAGKSIKSLKKDLESKHKFVSLSSVVKVNKLNRKIMLEDGTYLWELPDSVGTWKQGDKIKYSRTISNEHFFEITKLTPKKTDMNN